MQRTHEDVGGDENEAHVDVEADLEIDLLAASCKERLKDREHSAQESEASYKEAMEALEEAREQLQQWKAANRKQTSKEGDDSDDDSDDEEADKSSSGLKESGDSEQPEARLEARVADLELVVQEKESNMKLNVAAAEAAKEEFEALEKQWRALPSTSLEKLISLELQLARDLYDSHKQKESKVMQEAQKRMLAWAEQKEALNANLHRTDLEIKVAKEDAAATKRLRDSVRRGSDGNMNTVNY